MNIWQADFYKHSYSDEGGKPLWELVICNTQGIIIHEARCLQSQANLDWLVSQLQQAIQKEVPDIIQVFRPQSISLLSAAGKPLGISVEATRKTPALKTILQNRGSDINVEKLPPQALPDSLWGEGWRFATFPAGDIVDFFSDRPIPILVMPDSLLPLNLGIASSTLIPGIVIYGGKKSLYLARWLQEVKPVSLNYIPTEIGQSGGLVLEAGLVDRWIIATFDDREVAQAAQGYEQRKKASKGLHFLWVQPDDSGMTYTGFWLLQEA